MSKEKQPLYLQIRDHFKELIAENKLQSNEQIPTESEIMESFGVSRITVVKALAELANEGLIYRVRGRGTFVSEGSRLKAQERTEQKVKNIPKKVGMIVPYVTDLFMLRVLTGVQEVLHQEGISLLMATSGNSKQSEAEMIRDLLQSGVDGLIIFPVDAQIHNEELLALKMNQFPLVLIDRPLAGIETHFVGSDGFQGAKIALEYLWELGHREIAIISDSPLPTMTVTDRVSGYMEGLKEKGGLIDPQLILTEYKISGHEGNMSETFSRFLSSRKATAIIALHSSLGVQIYALAEKLGLSIPEDLSIVTFDNPVSDYDRFETFTHISQSEQDMGRNGARILLDIMRNKIEHGKYHKVIFEPRLVVKQTTAQIRV